MFKRKKQKKSAGKIRRARVKNIRKSQLRKESKKKCFPRNKKKRLREINWKKVGVMFLIACFLLFVIWVIVFSRAMKIKDVKIEGYNNKNEEILALVKDLESGKILNQKIKDNLILFPSKELVKNIQKKYPVIEKVDVQKVFPNQLVIKIKKREQIFLWEENKHCKVIDEAGMLVEEFDCNNDKNNLLKICDDKEAQLKLTCQVFMSAGKHKTPIETEDRQRIIQTGNQIIEALKTTFYFDNSLVIIVPELSSREIRVGSSSFGEVWFVMDKNLDKQLEKFRAFLEKKINFNDLQNILYIDLRLNNKIIYKFKEGYGDEELKMKNEK